MDTLILNVRYADSAGQPLKQGLDEKLVQELDYLQREARHAETVVASSWSFLGVAVHRTTSSSQAMALTAHLRAHHVLA